MIKSLFVLLLIVFSGTIYAQKNKMKFGKVDLEDLKMEYYSSDSTAEAAILYESGEFFPEKFKFVWRRRMKVYTKEGLNYLIINVPSKSKSDVRGFVYNLVDGEIVKEKISRDNIFNERIIDGFYRVRIAPPNVKEGSIIDLEFVFNGFPSKWQFQSRIPIQYSEIIIPENRYLTFRFQQTGYEEIASEKGGKYYTTDLPAFRPEPYISSVNNYMTQLLIDIKDLLLAPGLSTNYFGNQVSDWEGINESFREHDHFYDLINNSNIFLSDIRDSINSISTDQNEMLRLTLDAVRKNVSWNGTSNLWPNYGLKRIWDDGVGTSSDMNFLLMLLLDKLDIECYPVLMRTRSEGRINPYFPSTNRFNYVITCIKIGEVSVLVDASDKYTLPGFLPERAINEGGFIINEDKGEWLNIAIDKSSSKMISCNLKLDQSGMFEGQLGIKHSDYAASSFRSSFDKFTDSESYLEDFEESNPGCIVYEYSNDIEDSEYGSVSETMEVSFDNGLVKSGELISFNPVFVNRISENPFKLENREYPVDFVTPRTELYMLTISIPDGYKVEQLPKPISLKTENNAINFKYITQKSGNNIQLMLRLDIKKPVFIQFEYQELKTLYDLIYLKEQENIILKKIL